MDYGSDRVGYLPGRPPSFLSWRKLGQHLIHVVLPCQPAHLRSRHPASYAGPRPLHVDCGYLRCGLDTADFPGAERSARSQPKTCGRFLHAAVAAHRFRRGRRVADLATSDERGGGPVDLLFTQVRWPAGLPSAASDHALRRMALFGRITNLLMMRELILHRQDFHYLAAFERPGGKVSYFGRLARAPTPRMRCYAFPAIQGVSRSYRQLRRTLDVSLETREARQRSCILRSGRCTSLGSAGLAEQIIASAEFPAHPP